MAEDDTPVVEFQYNGMFINKPFIYFDPDKNEIMYADFREKGYAKFIAHLNVITRRMFKDVYYCPDGQTLCQGLATLQNECDYHEFLECLHEKKKVTVYVDHFHEPLFDWIEMEEPEVEDDTNSNADEDVDSMLLDKECWEHEVDDEDFSMKRATSTIQKKGRFLNKLCPNVEEEEESKVEQLPPVYPMHNSEQQWDEMAPVLGDPGSSTPAPIPTPGSTSATPRSTPATPRPRSTSATPRPRSTPATPRPRSTSARPVQSAVQLRKRKASERITKLCVRKQVVPKDGSGCSSEKPVDLS
ncbi:unnamed protein product [Lactuca virosa]|uniref:Uncharacterized protein n=1 Tax=Lactuca virosa TaxID=75947 RepID=A0AAU9NJL6_9ASTR|nr:unnamed protein product [Lactuca virosa]